METQKTKRSFDARTIAGLGALTAIVVVLQLFGSGIRFGPFSISLVNIPITIGAVLYGTFGGGWLGFVFGLVVLLSGDAALFLAVTIPGTIITVLSKGMLAGVCSAWAYKLLCEKNQTTATVAAALVCPVVNTGVFLICCFLFFYDTLAGWAKAAGMENVVSYMLVGLVGTNFIVELLVSAVLTPVILRLLKLIKSRMYTTQR